MSTYKIPLPDDNAWQNQIEFNTRDIERMNKKLDKVEDKADQADQKSDDTKNAINRTIISVIMSVVISFTIGMVSVMWKLHNISEDVNEVLLKSMTPKVKITTGKKIADQYIAPASTTSVHLWENKCTP